MWQDIVAFLDPLFLWAFRVPGPAWLAFGLGVVWVCLVAVLIGQLSYAGAYWCNGGYFRRMREDMVQQHNLSLRALAGKDKGSYKACNSLANDAFGKSFFAHIALFAASMWPAFFAMGWLAEHFGRVDFQLPLLGEVGPAFFFVPIYIVVRVLFHRIEPRLPLYGRLKRAMSENENAGEKMLTFRDLVEEAEGAKGVESVGVGQRDAKGDGHA